MAHTRCLVRSNHGKALSGDFASTVINAQQGTFADLRACRLILQYSSSSSSGAASPPPDLYLAPSALGSTEPPALWLGDREIVTTAHIAANFVNLGAGARIYAASSAAHFRTIVSSDASVTVTEGINEIDLAVAGGGGVGTTLWELSPAHPYLLTQKTPAAVHSVLLRSDDGGNAFGTSRPQLNSVVFGGNYNFMDGDYDNGIVASSVGTVVRTGNTFFGRCAFNALLGSYNSVIRCDDSGGLPTRVQGCTITGDSGTVFGQDGIEILNSHIYNSTGARIDGSGSGGYIGASNLVAGVSHRLEATGGARMTSVNIFAGFSNSIIAPNVNCTIVGGRQLTVPPNSSGAFMIGDDNFVSLAASAPNQFTARFSGGYRFYTDADATLGMTLAPMGSSWVAVSDVNKKDIHGEVDYGAYLARVAALPIYEYNYKGAPREARCVGPTAQDYHALFGCEYVEETEVEEDVCVCGAPVPPPHSSSSSQSMPSAADVVHVQRQQRTVPRHPAKDPLGIEQQDLIGVCLAAIKALGTQVAELKTQHAELKALLAA